MKKILLKLKNNLILHLPYRFCSHGCANETMRSHSNHIVPYREMYYRYRGMHFLELYDSSVKLLKFSKVILKSARITNFVSH